MSIFAVNHLCREVLRDHAFRAAMKADPAKALAHITSRQEVWLATGSEIVDWYKKNYLKT